MTELVLVHVSVVRASSCVDFGRRFETLPAARGRPARVTEHINIVNSEICNDIVISIRKVFVFWPGQQPRFKTTNPYDFVRGVLGKYNTILAVNNKTLIVEL